MDEKAMYKMDWMEKMDRERRPVANGEEGTYKHWMVQIAEHRTASFDSATSASMLIGAHDDA